MNKTILYLKEIKKFSSILNIIDIENFFHIRIIDEDNFFILSNNERIISLIYKNNEIGDFFEKIVKKTTSGKISFFLWRSNESDAVLKKILPKKINNGISISLRLFNYVDIFSFSSNIESHNFYLNHLNLLKRFIIYFRLKAKDVIDDVHHNHAHLLARRIKFNVATEDQKTNILENFRKQIPPRKLIIQDNMQKIRLTPRETQHLFLMLEGKSMRKIAKELGISQRTVESCLESIKLKMGYTTKSRLLADFFEQQLYQPSIYYDRHT